MTEKEFLAHIIAKICVYAKMNGMEPDDTLQSVADSIKALLGVCTFNGFECGELKMTEIERNGKGLGETMDDMVRVVRCKDCKYGRFNEKDGLFCDWHYMYNPFGYGQEGYCLYGERMDEDEERTRRGRG